MSCGCHDPAVFGHQARCRDDLGPERTGGPGRPPCPDPGHYGAEYGTPITDAHYIRMVSARAPRITKWYAGVIRSVR